MVPYIDCKLIKKSKSHNFLVFRCKACILSYQQSSLLGTCTNFQLKFYLKFHCIMCNYLLMGHYILNYYILKQKNMTIINGKPSIIICYSHYNNYLDIRKYVWIHLVSVKSLRSMINNYFLSFHYKLNNFKSKVSIIHYSFHSNSQDHIGIN